MPVISLWKTVEWPGLFSLFLHCSLKNKRAMNIIIPQADQAMALLMICNGRSRFDSNDRNAP